MILTNKVEVKIANSNIKHYKKCGYNYDIGDVIMVDVYDIAKCSKINIEVSCDLCGYERSLSVYNYWKNYNKNNYNIYTCHKCCVVKRKMTFNERFGVDHPMQLDEIKFKQTSTIESRYGVSHYSKTKEFKYKVRETMVGNNMWSDDINEFKRYRNVVRNLTRNNKLELFTNWNGYDFYDGEYIKCNDKLHFNDRNYPTIDHKISILYGFRNNITTREISHIDNLCITKRGINSSKGNNCSDEFIEQL